MPKKIIAWADSKGIREKISSEFEEVTFVSSFEEFKEKVSTDTLNIMDTSMMDDISTSDLVTNIEKFVAYKPEVMFHIFYCMEDDRPSSGLCVGHIMYEGKKENVKSYIPVPHVPLLSRINRGI